MVALVTTRAGAALSPGKRRLAPPTEFTGSACARRQEARSGGAMPCARPSPGCPFGGTALPSLRVEGRRERKFRGGHETNCPCEGQSDRRSCVSCRRGIGNICRRKHRHPGRGNGRSLHAGVDGFSQTRRRLVAPRLGMARLGLAAGLASLLVGGVVLDLLGPARFRSASGYHRIGSGSANQSFGSAARTRASGKPSSRRTILVPSTSATHL
jgi:hypothetical protein